MPADNTPTKAYAALHESGHAVMARLQGLRLGPLKITGLGPSASGSVSVCGPPTPEESFKILAAARICLNTFNINTVLDQGGFSDEGESRTILDEIFPDDENQQVRDDYTDRIDREVTELFEKPNILAAVRALAEILTSACEIDGLQAEAIIDRYLAAGTKTA